MRSLSPFTPFSGSSDASLRSRFILLAGANAASVTALYWGQALAKPIADDFPGQTNWLPLVPSGTLAGYAVGVCIIAFSPSARGSLSVTCHMGLLAMGLCAAGLAPNAATLACASIGVGCGAAVAQRLLAAAARLGGTTHAGSFIGKTICVALTAVLGVRLAGETVARIVGWRTGFFVAAAMVAVFGLLNQRLRAPNGSGTPVVSDSIGPLWRGSPMLRWAAFQQSALFAAYNAAWMVTLVAIPAEERAAVVIGGGTAGVITALLAGHCVDRFRQRDLARAGAIAVFAATAFLLPLAYGLGLGLERTLFLLSGMALVDAGLQLALVANQTRVQALMTCARPRLAALLTVCGSLGGAAGAGIGYWSWQRFGWQAAIGGAALASLTGLICSLLAAPKRLNDTSVSVEQGCSSCDAVVLNPAALRGLPDEALRMSVRA